MTCEKILGETGIKIERYESPDIKIRRDKYTKFLQDQIQEIMIHKWIESEKAMKDVGEDACIDWIVKYAGAYREKWERINGKL
jgi:hypothetical protein